ncbi:MAG: hypothetical protein J0L70_31555 [Leptolyngbya sp. UWPOB_LEPTO1]|uniref:hypothetical protein n=1 Tax=Leptolyngbya sp. UWPOB_LEPTO1 TaxID=2815653 RepID=UPI001ACD292E|nr:hypothetical protein [Leptolyngbya sp. UWPOB_LEPTO1]MBN8565049.1 hypothetical protein [Leptolyngbya sp. UWPOB_LEPTO1]
MRHLSFVCFLSCFAIAGCNAAQIDAKVTPTQATAQPSKSLNIQINAQVEESPKPEANQIAEGRYWLGGTGQALEVQGEYFRYETEGGTQPWRSLSELQAVKTEVVFDGKLYWCLSTMQPKSEAATCSKEGWVTQESSSIPVESSGEPSRKINLNLGIYNVGSTYIQIAAKGDRQCLHIFSMRGWRVGSITPDDQREGVYRVQGWDNIRLSQPDPETLLIDAVAYQANHQFSQEIDENLQQCLDSEAPFERTGQGRT